MGRKTIKRIKVVVTLPSWFTRVSNVFHFRVCKDKRLILLGCMAFAASLYVYGEHFTAGVVAARMIEAIGDVLFDRGLV